MDLVFVPYSEIGNLKFNVHREKTISLWGEPVSQSKYGYPEKNKYSDDYGFFHILCSENKEFEAIQLFPDMTDEEISLFCDGQNIVLSADANELIKEINKLTDDFNIDDDGEGYTSKKLGLRIYCPDGIVEEVIIHNRNYYDND